jgi:hypothetical protein
MMHACGLVHLAQGGQRTFFSKISGESLDYPVGVAQLYRLSREGHTVLGRNSYLAQNCIHQTPEAFRRGIDCGRHCGVWRRAKVDELMGADAKRRSSSGRWILNQESVDQMIERSLLPRGPVDELRGESFVPGLHVHLGEHFGQQDVGVGTVLVDSLDGRYRYAAGIVGHRPSLSSEVG